jgi:predicted secreted hydrolase
MEWWYYTGVLETAAGERYGFELTTFQAMLYKAPVYIGHFAVTDLQKGTFHKKMDASAEDQREAVPEGFSLKVGTFEMSGHAGKDQIRAEMPGYALDLSLEALKPMVLQYGDGVMTVGSDEPFYYYSYTRMAITGSITVDGQQKSVTGVGWMDHQWGTIGSGYGWDWFSLRLDDETEVMLFEVRHSGVPGFVGGTFIDKDGSARELTAGEFTTQATGQWTSPHTQIVYAQGWTIQVPSLDLDVELTAVMEDQEFNASIFDSPIYWEGLCDVSGTRAGQGITGHAYVEITGNFN